MGLRVAVGSVDFFFSQPVWQAGIGEAAIGLLLLAAAWRDRWRPYVTAYALSALGIAFGLVSQRVVGAAREIHVILVPLAVAGIALLAWRRSRQEA